MEAAAVVTLIGVAVTVAALAYYLIRVALVLKGVQTTLNGVIGGVGAIAQATEPVGPVLGAIATDLASTRDALEGLLAKKTGKAPPKPEAALEVKPVLASRLEFRNRNN